MQLLDYLLFAVKLLGVLVLLRDQLLIHQLERFILTLKHFFLISCLFYFSIDGLYLTFLKISYINNNYIWQIFHLNLNMQKMNISHQFKHNQHE